jgi:peptidoglycan/xylan/chitin deacetylase (PgdA/CDA1 family)
MLKSYFDVTITITIVFTIILYPLLPTLDHGQQQFAFAYQTIIKNQINNRQNESPSYYTFSAYTTGGQNNINSTSRSGTNKVVILNFYDDDKSQITNAKPILDKYGFKVTFFIVCNWAGSDNSQRMTWQDINQLYKEGHDIESHSMTHKRLNELSSSSLDFELGKSRQCLYDHLGINATVFSPPHSAGWNNATVINAIAKYYNLSIGGFVTDPMFLHCYGWKQQQQQSSSQTDCRTYSDNGTLNFANRYDIKERTHNALDKRYLHNDTQIFEKFVELVDSQANFNKNGTLNAVPIIGYHDIDNNKTITSTDVNLFDAEMKYLHDNGFKVLTMSDLGFDENSNYLYVKNKVTPQQKAVICDPNNPKLKFVNSTESRICGIPLTPTNTTTETESLSVVPSS